MTWQKLTELPDQKIIGAYDIEFWAIRDGKVWHQGRKLVSADTETFEVLLNHEFIARDLGSVYHAWSRLTKIDRDSFRIIGDYWQDKNAVYFEFETSLKVLPDADTETFRVLGNGYGADNNGAWYYGRKIKCNQPLNLQVITENVLFARDGENIYFDGKPLLGVNYDQWRLLHDDFSRDEKRIYYCERKLPNVDSLSWQHLYGSWSKDKKHVFHMNFIEKGILSENFDKEKARKKSEG